MKYLFVFLLLGLFVSCGGSDASGEATGEAVKKKTETAKQPNCDEIDGLIKSWHENGLLKSEWNYKDCKLNGLERWWYENGQLWYEANYKDGELISKKCWDEDGNETDCE